MADITMPKLSDTMTEGTLVSWKKKPGDAVTMGEVIAEVETDKATMEMEAFEDGVISEIFVKEGQKVAIGERIARIGGDGDSGGSAPPAQAKAGAHAAAPEKDAKQGGEASPPPAAKGKTGHASQDGAEITLAEEPPDDAGPVPAAEEKEPAAGGGDGARVKASPLARKVAKEHGVDLASLTGSGPGGRIIQRDVLAAKEGGGAAAKPRPMEPAAAPAAASTRPGPTAPAAPTSAPRPAPVATAAKDQRIPLSSMRKTIADRLLQSKTTIPHFYLHIEVDAGPLMRLRSELNAAGEKDGIKLSVNDFILKATVAAIGRTPKVNAAFDGDAIVQYGSVNLAVAVAVDDGLVTPVIRDAQNKSLRDISAAVKDFAVRARARKLKPDEYQGGTFTVSNLGGYGIDKFDAIINPPQSVILSVGAVVKKPVVGPGDTIIAGHRLDLGLSCDHRVVDGALGAEFLAALRRLLEQPALMLI